jgi:phage shock protein PspC (stress-responsive transcriptional regulator)
MSEHITHTPRIRRLERSSSDRVLAGVSGGLGRYFDLSPAVFRVGFVVLTVLGGAGLLVYLAAVLIMPEEGKERSLVEQVLAERSTRPWPLLGLALAGFALVVLLSHATLWPAAGAGWFIILLVGLALVWASRGRRRSSRVLRVLAVLSAVVLTAIAAAIIAAFAWFDVSLNDGVGKHEYTPSSVSAVAPSYELGVGDLRIDLSDIGPISSPLRVKAKVGVGDLRVVVPQGVPVTVDGHVKAGSIEALGQSLSGRNVDLEQGSGLLTIEGHVGLGDIHVERAG